MERAAQSERLNEAHGGVFVRAFVRHTALAIHTKVIVNALTRAAGTASDTWTLDYRGTARRARAGTYPPVSW